MTAKNKKSDPGIAWDQYEATGMENVSQEDLGIPFLGIVQKGSPEFDKTHPSYETKKVPGCQPGSIVHATMKKVVGDDETPLHFVPCAYERLYVEWRPRDSGGGFVRHHTNPMILSQTKRDDKSRDVLENGNVISTTAYFYGLLTDGKDLELEEPEKVIIAMTSTQLKKSRQWLNLATSLRIAKRDGSKFTPPLFSHAYSINTIAESNEQGSWYGWNIEVLEMVNNNELATMAAEIASSIKTGQHRRLLGAPPGESESNSEAPF
jgi:hypothetical protein